MKVMIKKKSRRNSYNFYLTFLFFKLSKATIIETGEKVAIKKVFQDKRFKNRELQIIKEINHPNVVRLRQAFYTTGEVHIMIINKF